LGSAQPTLSLASNTPEIGTFARGQVREIVLMTGLNG